MTLHLIGHVTLPEHKGKGGFDHAVHAASGHLCGDTANDAVDVFDPACAGNNIFGARSARRVAGAPVSDESGLIFLNRAADTIGMFTPGPARPFASSMSAGDPMASPTILAGKSCWRPMSAPGGAPLAHAVDDRPRPRRAAHQITVPGRTRWAVFAPGRDFST
jgi:hypothetical protein